MTDRKKPGVPFWAAVTLVVATLYIASFGPACWIASRVGRGTSVIDTLYKPITLAMSREDQTCVAHLIFWYAEIGARANWWWSCPMDVNPDGTLKERIGEWSWRLSVTAHP